MAKFSDKLLRKMEQKNSSKHYLLNQGLEKLEKTEVTLAKSAIQSGLKALKHGFLKASDIIPRLLDLLSKF